MIPTRIAPRQLVGVVRIYPWIGYGIIVTYSLDFKRLMQKTGFVVPKFTNTGVLAWEVCFFLANPCPTFGRWHLGRSALVSACEIG